MTYSSLLEVSEDTRPAITALDEMLRQAGNSVADIRRALERANEDLVSRFLAGQAVTELVRLRAAIVDRVVIELWHEHAASLAGLAALVAVGGYGRGELHPCSDVDVMLLLPGKLPADSEQMLSSFLTSLWDIGLEIGHSVRTVKQCRQQARDDITIATTLIEARLLDGPESLFDKMTAAVQQACFDGRRSLIG